MNGKILGLLTLFIVFASLLTGAAFADFVPVTVDSVKIDGDIIHPWDVNRLSVERGDDIEIRVKFTAYADAENVQVEAEIRGYEYDDQEDTDDITRSFDVETNVSYTKTLDITVPSRMEEDDYMLRITVTDRNNDQLVYNFNLKIDAPRHSMVIKDVVLTPENQVRAGRALLATARVKNMGDRDEDSVKVTISIPSLGISASDYIDEVESDDSETSEELYLRIPVCAEAGSYDVLTKVEYDDLDMQVTKVTSIDVVESDVCEASGTGASGQAAEPDVVVGSSLENVVPGEGGAIFPITITNNAGTRKTFSVTVDGVNDWGTVKISPTSTVVIGAGKEESLFIFVAANSDAASGQQVFTATVKSGSNTIEQAALTANIVEPQADGWNSAKKGLEIALVVLVALLVILGLIIGFSKLKNEDDDDSEETETYY